MSKRYNRSEKMLERTLKTIPLGSQTFSKSKTQFPYGVSPYFVTRGKGSHVWDVDGNEYVDFINSLAAVTLGYNDPDVTAAVRSQLKDGVIFSLPHPIEAEVAEKIVEMVPCAEMVRFGKNGSDATSGAIRLARAYTGKDHVAVCGYHGWQDWYIGSTARSLGVPEATRKLTHAFKYNDMDSLHSIFKKFHGRVSAVIMEPMNVEDPVNGFLENARELAHKNGAVFIFDETVTGFRFSNGGAQEYFGVTPDLATFGKGLANGYPVSAVTGKAEIMRLMEEVFFSFTFGGEALSLAAALATMKKLQKKPVIKTIWKQGAKAKKAAESMLKKYALEDALGVKGKDCWSFLVFNDTKTYSQWELKTLFLQEMYSRGFLTIGTHNMSYSHTDKDMARLLTAYDEVFAIIKDVLTDKSLAKRLKAKPLVPLFKVR